MSSLIIHFFLTQKYATLSDFSPAVLLDGRANCLNVGFWFQGKYF